jgi:hypothetical protein
MAGMKEQAGWQEQTLKCIREYGRFNNLEGDTGYKFNLDRISRFHGWCLVGVP